MIRDYLATYDPTPAPVVKLERPKRSRDTWARPGRKVFTKRTQEAMEILKSA